MCNFNFFSTNRVTKIQTILNYYMTWGRDTNKLPTQADAHNPS